MLKFKFNLKYLIRFIIKSVKMNEIYNYNLVIKLIILIIDYIIEQYCLYEIKSF